MTPDDKEFARRALEEGLLTIDQVTRLKQECQETGRPLAALAEERGLLPSASAEAPAGKPSPAPAAAGGRPATPQAREAPARPARPRVLEAVLGLASVLMIGLLYLSIKSFRAHHEQTEEMADHTSRAMAEGEEMYQKSLRTYQEKRTERRESEAQAALAKGREALAAAEARPAGPLDPDLYIQLSRAVQGFSVYLESHPRDAAVLVRRSRAWELRGEYEKASRDLEEAVSARADWAGELRPRIADLRARLRK